MQTNDQIIPEQLETTKIIAHKKGLNNEIAVRLGQAEQKRMYRTMRELLADELVFVLHLEVSSVRCREG